MHNPFLATPEEIEELNALQKQYPYCASISMLLSKAYHTQESISFEQQLKNTAISVPNRTVLYELISQEEIIATETATKVEKTLEVENPAVENGKEKEGVDIQEYEVIYKLIEDVEGILEGMLEPEVIETETGELKVKGIFYSKGKRQIVGGKVEKGFFEKGTQVKIMRRSEETNEFEKIGEAELSIIQHFEEKVNRIESPKECGLELVGFAEEYKEDDIIIGVSTKTILKKLK